MKKVLFGVIAFALSFLLLTGCGGKTETVTCTYDQTVSSVQLNSKVIITLVDSKFDKMDMTIEAILPENLMSSKKTFLDSFNTQYASFEDEYGVKPVITETDTGILVTINMNGEQAKKYSGSSNLKTSREEVIKEFEKQKFKCK